MSADDRTRPDNPARRPPPDDGGLDRAVESGSPETALDRLTRQVERGGIFTNTALGRSGAQLAEVESYVYGLLEALFAKGVVAADEVIAAAERVREVASARGEVPEPGVAIRIDEPGTKPGPPVDCAARMHVCHAVCCSLRFALNAHEIEAGRVRWDLGRPYFIRHEADGYCTHNDRACGRCRVYADRPAVCRTYSCVGDARIWTDFEGMKLNTEWIAANLGPQAPRGVEMLLWVS